MNTKQKKEVTKEEFEKRVEIEVSHLTYIDRIPKEIAMNKARKDLAELYQIVE